MDSRDKSALVAAKRCAVALRRVFALLLHFFGGLSREVSLRPAKGKWTVVTDASPWESGALLSDTTSACVLEAFEVTWGPDDTANLGLVIGDSASQALAEFLTVFLAVVVWKAKLAQEGFAFQVRSDSTTALSSTASLQASRSSRTSLPQSWVCAWRSWAFERLTFSTCRATQQAPGKSGVQNQTASRRGGAGPCLNGPAASSCFLHPFEGQCFVELCQLKSLSRVSFRERSWQNEPFHRCPTNQSGAVCYGRSIAWLPWRATSVL